jgi:translation initiation factor IF-3
LKQKPTGKGKGQKGPRVNRQIRVPEVLLIDETGTRLGIIPTEEALSRTWEKGLDLVEVNPNESPPVCKMIDFGKLKYQERKKRTTSKSGGGELKELGLSMKIGDHDLETKVNQAKKFLERGYKVRFNLLLRGREKSYHDTLAQALLDRIIQMLAEEGNVDSRSKGLVGNRLFVIITASRKKGGKPGAVTDAKNKDENPSGDRQAGAPDKEREAS